MKTRTLEWTLRLVTIELSVTRDRGGDREEGRTPSHTRAGSRGDSFGEGRWRNPTAQRSRAGGLRVVRAVEGSEPVGGGAKSM